MKHRPLSVIVIGITTALGIMFLTGCASQISALAPVGGDTLVSVRTAATNVLQDQGLDILVAPMCTQTQAEISCAGSLTDNQEFHIKAPLDDSFNMTITLNGSIIFEGNYQDVLNKAAGAN